MPISFGFNIVEGKVHKSKKKNEEDGERRALRELQTILSAKNRKPCDCEAQVHELIENCLKCGRLTCSAEGSGKCISCGNLILTQEQRERFKDHVDVMQPPAAAGHSATSSGPSTKIIDNQFDHFTIDNSKHLREEDRRRLREHLEELQAQRYKRKLVLEIDIDNLEAGSHSVAQIDDYEQALRDLQLNQQSTVGLESSRLLSELVQVESKRSYGFDYIEAKEPPKEKPSVDIRKANSDRSTKIDDTKIYNTNQPHHSNNPAREPKPRVRHQVKRPFNPNTRQPNKTNNKGDRPARRK